MRLIILAAGQGTRLAPLTNDIPKCLTPLLGKPLLQWQIEAANKVGIKDIIVVGGYYCEKLSDYPVTVVKNNEYKTTNMVYSLLCAKEYLKDDVVVSYGDIVYEPSVLEKLINSPYEISVVIDKAWQAYWENRFVDPLSDAESLELDDDFTIKSIGKKVSSISSIQGQYIGLSSYRASGLVKLLDTFNQLKEKTEDKEKLNTLYMTDLIQAMITNGQPVYAIPIQRAWFEIDNMKDLEIAQKEWLKMDVEDKSVV